MAALTDLGAVFDRGRDGAVARTREGGHSTRRIIHAGGDATGAEVQRALACRRAAGLCRDHVALDGCSPMRAAVTGLLVARRRGLGVVHAPAVLLATGGLGQLYAAQHQPARGDRGRRRSRAGRRRAGRRSRVRAVPPDRAVHPRRLGRRPLISEAVRGEGAILVDADGDSVTAGVHPRGDLAPRDVVSRRDRRAAAGTGDRPRLPRRPRASPASRSGSRPSPPRAWPPASTRAAADPGRARPRTIVRRSGHRRRRPHRGARPLRGGRGGPHRAARREPVGLQQSARRPGGRRAGRRARPPNARPPRRGNRARAAGPVPSGPPRDLQRAMTANASVVRDGAGLRRWPSPLGGAPRTVPEGEAALEDAALTLTARALVAAAAARTEMRGCHHRARLPGRRPTVAPQHGTVRSRRRRTRAVRRQTRRSAVMPTMSLPDGLDAARCARCRTARWTRTCGTARTSRRVATVPADAVDEASVVIRARRASSPASTSRLLVLDEVIGAGGYQVLDRRRRRRPASCPASRADRHGAHPGPAHRGADDAQPGLPPVRHRHRDRRLGGRGRGHRREDPRQPQDAAGTAGAAEVRRPGRRRRQPPDGPRRRGPDQGQPRRGGRFGGGGAAGRARARHRTSRARSRSTASSSSTRCWPRTSNWCCSTTSRSGRPRSRCNAATTPPATKLESSGGLTLDAAADYAGTGVDYLAVGALTHSVRVLDLGLDV